MTGDAETLQIPTIKRWWLLAVYAVIPLVLILVGVDILFLDQALQPYLTTHALKFPLIVLLFELPHIIASLVTFADKEYVQFYRRHLTRELPLKLVVFSILFYISIPAGVVAYVFYTMYHCARQQTGLALTMTRKKDIWHEVWTYVLVFGTFVGYMLIFAKTLLPRAYETFGEIALVPLSILVVLLTAFIVYRAPKGIARWYTFAVGAASMVSFLFLLLNYLFLAAFILRFIHDVTAFIVYIFHDRSRNQLNTHNALYRPLVRLGVPVLLATPLVAVIIAYMLRSELMSIKVGAVAIMLIGVMHYSLEGVMWKRQSIHRGQLRFE
jgi:hypothetical protein